MHAPIRRARRIYLTPIQEMRSRQLMGHTQHMYRAGSPILAIWMVLCLVLQSALAGLWSEPTAANVDPVLAQLGVVLCQGTAGDETKTSGSDHADRHCFEQCLHGVSNAAPIVPPDTPLPTPVVLYQTHQLAEAHGVLSGRIADAHRARDPPVIVA